MVADLESANEELKVSNEEAMSMNEELQSTNEELETSKEELQSLNEELTTVNAQLEEKVADLERTNNDLDNLLASTHIATLFFDREFRIKRYTPASTRLFNLIPSDLDRPVADIANKFSDAHLLSDAQKVLDTLTPIERKVRTVEGEWYIQRVLPYRTHEDRIEGVVVIYTEITKLKRGEEALRESEERFRTLAETVPNIIFTHRPDGFSDYTNPRFYEFTGLPPGAADGFGSKQSLHPRLGPGSIPLAASACGGRALRDQMPPAERRRRLPLAPDPWPPDSRREWPSDQVVWRVFRHRRPGAHAGGLGAGPEDGGRRPTDRRYSSRFQ